MKNNAKYNVDLVLKHTNALSGTPKILMRQAFSLVQDNVSVNVISETFHPNLLQSPDIKCLKTWKWPRTTLFQRQFFDWQARRKTRPGSIVIGHGDSLYQNILFLHTCVHLGAEVAPGPHNDKNLSIPFHRMIFEQGHFDEVVCVTNMMKDDVQKRFNIQKPMHVIYPGHEKDIAKQIVPEAVQELKDKIKVKNGELVVAVICSGDLQNRGAFALLRSMAFLTQEEKNSIKIFIVGKETHPSKVYNLAQDMGMRERVFWMPPRSDVANIISVADVVVHAANIEASGLTFMEFMAMSKPVITTKTVGFSEILPDIQKDFIIPKQDAEAIAQKLKVVLKDSELRRKMGEENQKAAAPYTWEGYDHKFMKIMNNYMQNR